MGFWNVNEASMEKISIEFAPEDITDKICVVAIAANQNVWVAFEHYSLRPKSTRFRTFECSLTI